MNFIKAYTRDTTLIIQQGWLYANTFGLFSENPYDPFTIFYMSHGTLEIWEHEKTTEWIKERLQKECSENPENILQILNNYKFQLGKFDIIWASNFSKNKDDFFQYLELMLSTITGYFYMYYLAMDERTPKSLFDVAFELRESDKFFDANDLFIRITISNLFPEYKGIETAVLLEEVRNVIPSVEIIKKRLQGFFMLPSNHYELLNWDEFKNKYPDFEFEEDIIPDQVSEIKGSIAYRGVIKGVVKVIWNKNDIGKVSEGDIIVSPMTTPALIQAMQKASAFITDEGGITCHAAIVAREMNKPCIIGTKIATKVLKDGDLVEVDAEKGVVMVIK